MKRAFPPPAHPIPTRYGEHPVTCFRRASRRSAFSFCSRSRSRCCCLTTAALAPPAAAGEGSPLFTVLGDDVSSAFLFRNSIS